jgi:thiol-disulfide isomerase/thioredoxin
LKAPILLIISALLLAACAPGVPATGGDSAMKAPADAAPAMPAPPSTLANLPDLGPAPELENKVWLNTDHPLRLQDLRGKVVLLEMWTFDCINCQHVIPELRSWYDTYSSKGLVIIGNHFPEFDYEKDLANLKQAIQRLDVPYPVAQDNDGKTWDAYSNHFWPTAYLIDKRGHIRYIQIGEGEYDRTEAAIQNLLSETYAQ